MDADAITQTQQGLTELAEWIEAHPGIGSHPFLSGTTWIIGVYTADQAAFAMRAMADGAPLGSVEKDVHGEKLFAERNFTGGVRIQMQVPRDEVCEWVVTGTETVTVPDPEVVAAAPVVEIEREIGEWQCHPILPAVPA